MLAFAIGGLLGDVFFHTLPHITGGGHNHSHEHTHDHSHHDHSHEHSNDHHHEHSHDLTHDHDLDEGHSHDHAHDSAQMKMNFIVILGILAFFLIERVTHALLEDGHSHGHSHGHTQDVKNGPPSKK
jgi:hypothetical protein